MSTEVTSSRLATQLGDKVIVTDIDICQRVLPAPLILRASSRWWR